MFLFCNHSALVAAHTAKDWLVLRITTVENRVRLKPKKSISALLNDSQLGGGDVKSIDVRGEAGEGLLGAVGAIGG